MSQVSLFRKWRSQSFSDLVGQESVVRTLRNVLAGGSPARAYLFCGPRGTGKTSTARIFAKAICCERGPALEPCNECDLCREIAAGSCMDVFEIDAASHTQVDKIRDFIVDKVHFAPARARYKVYIIDEVHKLSGASFNALLKTLEEPPAHVVFILATTHPHELLPTILSRCQRHDFRPFRIQEIRQRLGEIAEHEGLQLSPEAAITLASSAEGSMRDALVLLEQAASYCGKQIDDEEVVRLLGLVPFRVLEQLTERLLQGDAAGLLEEIQALADGGQDFARLGELLQQHFRQLMLLRLNARDTTIEELPEAAQTSLRSLAAKVQLAQVLVWLKILVEMQQAVRDGGPPRLLCEMALVKLAVGSAADAPAATGAPSAANAQAATIPPAELAGLRKELAELRAQVERIRKEPAGKPPAVSEPEREPAGRAKQQAGPSERPRPETQAAPTERARPEPPPQTPQPERPRPEQKTAPAERPRSTEQPAPKTEPIRPADPIRKPAGKPSPKEFWQALLEALRERKQMQLRAFLYDARIEKLEDGLLSIVFPPKYDLHAQGVRDKAPLIEQLSQELMGAKVKLECRVDNTRQRPSDEQEHEAMVKKARGLFPGEIMNRQS